MDDSWMWVIGAMIIGAAIWDGALFLRRYWQTLELETDCG